MDVIGNEEIILRHIPPGSTFQSPPDFRISSFNFQLRAHESGISVSRAGITNPASLIARLGDPDRGSRIAALSAGEIRAFGFEVVPVPIPEDPGHAEIRSGTADLNDRNTRRKFAALFRYVAPPSET
jgi:hypothetical protein